MQRDFIFTFVYQNNENMIDCLFIIKESLFIFLSLSLSFTHSTMTYKKRISLLSFKMGKDVSYYGKIDTFENIY
jgi:hypothetical protein